MTDRYPLVQQPLQIGTLTLKNRIMMAPISLMHAENGFVTEKLLAYYKRRAEGGVGMIITEHTGISEAGRGARNMLMFSSEEYVPGMKRLTEAIQAAGAAHALELNFSGRKINPADVTEEEMQAIAADWAAAAVRAKEIGVSGVIVHMANGYLLHRFLSPIFNQRTDNYGGNARNRARFPELVLKTVRSAVGPEYPVWVRLSMEEELPGGIEIADALVTAELMVAAGADALDLSAGGQTSVFRVHPTYYREDALNMKAAAVFKEHFSVPIISGGKVRDLATAEQALEKGCCDGVFMGRPLLADPDLYIKSIEGREDEVNPCLSCNTCNKTSRLGDGHCCINPCAGHELDIVAHTKNPQKVLVIGGGVAGLQAACSCAEAGHMVTLAERSAVLGGHARNAAIPERKERINLFVDRLIARAQRAGADIRTECEITADNIDSFGADAIILAAGASPRIPTFLPGLDTMTNLLTFEEVLTPEEPDRVGKKVLILGGGEVGAEMADYLAVRGREVTIIEMTPAIIADASAHIQHDLGERLAARNVEIYTETKVSAFDHNSVIAELPDGSKRTFSGYDQVILAMGLVSRTPAMEAVIAGKAARILYVGDSNRPRGIYQALEEGLLAAGKLEE